MQLEFTRKKTNRRGINLIPMINIIFLLVIFFMVSGNFEPVTHAAVTLPMAENGKVLDAGELNLVLGADKSIRMGEISLEPQVVEATIRQKLSDQPGQVITLVADASLEAEFMIDVLEAIKRAGGVNVSLVTRSK